ncbi:CDGSH iron-sulfur domain-containing protein 2 homolog B-like [Ruditapes philippinarum]|uniref:CDGSH iron-sulfur domain-containing protein 2 homolog B-like n=1 Tax=Ruditapes philippinarum TaxID=129788 RepID=UPI00295B4B4F|nr:CDGSH iron-sulfur domain-containing protein 2 homolog B-like [Ruditapes philippinarum]
MLNSKQDWLQVLPYVGLLGCVSYIAYSAYKRQGGNRINKKVVSDKDKDKIVTMVDIEDVGDKTAYCRCWKSNKFPLCDGTHNKHNAENCDNVGPLVMTRKE